MPTKPTIKIRPIGAVHGTCGGVRSKLLEAATSSQPVRAPKSAATASARGGVVLTEPPVGSCEVKRDQSLSMIRSARRTTPEVSAAAANFEIEPLPGSSAVGS